MSARDPQPGEKYQVRRRAHAQWEYVEVLRQDVEQIYHFTRQGKKLVDEPQVVFRAAVNLPALGIPKSWSRREDRLQLSAWRRAVTQGNVRSLPEHWGPDMLPDEPVPLAVRVRQWCDKQPPSEALDELKSILGEAR